MVKFSKYIKPLFIVLLILVGLFIIFKPTFTSGFKYSQTDIGDSVLNNYFLEHSYQTAFNREYDVPVWSPQFFYPANNVLTYSDNLWASAPYYWLIRAFTNPETSFQLWMIMMFIFNFLSFYLLSRSLKVNIWISAGISFLFAFGLPRLGQLSHQQLLPQFYSIIALFFLIEYISLKKINYYLLFLVFVALQILAGIYLGWLFLISLIPFVFFLIIFKRKEYFKLFFNAKVLISTSLLIFCVVAIFFPYFKSYQNFGKWPYEFIEKTLPRPISYVNPVPNSIFSDLYSNSFKEKAYNLPMVHEQFLSLGFSFYLLVFISSILFLYLYYKEEREEKISVIASASLLTFVFLTLISLYFPILKFSLWEYIYAYVPGAGIIRAVSRIWLVSYIYLFIGVGFITSYLYNNSRQKSVKILLLVLLLFASLEQITKENTHYNKIEEREIHKQMSEYIINQTEIESLNAFYVRWVGDDHETYNYHIKAMWAGMHLGVPTINGYSGKTPIGYKYLGATMTYREIGCWLDKNSSLENGQKVLVIDSEIKDGKFIVHQSNEIYFDKQVNYCDY